MATELMVPGSGLAPQGASPLGCPQGRSWGSKGFGGGPDPASLGMAERETQPPASPHGKGTQQGDRDTAG